jgi:hypothetical protein
MDQETREVQAPLFEESHPWITLKAEAEEDDSLDEVIRYTLDELRFA